MSFAATGVKLCPAPEPVSLPQLVPAPAPVLEPEREKLLLAHLPQVRFIAENLRERLRFHTELDDLIGYGVIGLLKAMERFDPSRGILLKTYAEHRIRGAILDGLRGMDWLSRTARQKKRLDQQASFDSQQPSAAQQTVKPSHNAATAPARFVATELIYVGTNMEEMENLSERLGLRQMEGGYSENPETLYQRKENRQRLAVALTLLPLRHCQVLQLYYGRELCMKEISQILNVHESRVSQLHSLALQRLRKVLANGKQALKPGLSREQRMLDQPPARKRSKCRVTARKSSSVSTPMVSSVVSAT